VDPRVIERFRGCFVRVRSPDGEAVGAGFLVTEDGDVLTCAHVVARALSADAQSQSSPRGEVWIDFPFLDAAPRPARVCRWIPQGPASAPAGDVAVLRVEAQLPHGVVAARLTMDQGLFGRGFRTHGYPRRHDAGVFAYGELRDRLSNGWLQVEDVKGQGRSIEPGFSGGPVQDRTTGRVVGMVVAATADPADKVAFVITADLLARAWPVLAVERAPDAGTAARAAGGSRLTVVSEESGDQPLFSGVTALVRFGRDPASDVVLGQPASWEHGRILLSGGAYVYQHLGRRPIVIRHRTGEVVALNRGERDELTLRQADQLALAPALAVTVRFELVPEADYEPTVWRTLAAPT
jgi:hypothetical protein